MQKSALSYHARAWFFRRLASLANAGIDIRSHYPAWPTQKKKSWQIDAELPQTKLKLARHSIKQH
jgi:hypothetical protein